MSRFPPAIRRSSGRCEKCRHVGVTLLVPHAVEPELPEAFALQAAIGDTRRGGRRFQVPANRIGYTALTLPQLKILQEAVSLLVFVPFSVFYMRAPVSLDYLWASLCILGAVFFMFRSSWLDIPVG